MKFLEGIVVLEIPLHDMLLSKTFPINFYKKMLLELSTTINFLIKITLTRMSCGNELYFLKHLEENNYKIEFISLKEFAERLNINIRILNRLSKSKVIFKEGNYISVPNIKRFNRYIKSLTSI